MIEGIINLPATPARATREEKREESERIAAETAEFLAAGGKINVIESAGAPREVLQWTWKQVRPQPKRRYRGRPDLAQALTL